MGSLKNLTGSRTQDEVFSAGELSRMEADEATKRRRKEINDMLRELRNSKYSEGANSTRTLSPNHPNSPDRGASPTVSSAQLPPAVNQLLASIRMQQFQRMSSSASGGLGQAAKALLLGPGGVGTTLSEQQSSGRGYTPAGLSGGAAGALVTRGQTQSQARSATNQNRIQRASEELQLAELRKKLNELNDFDPEKATARQRARNSLIYGEDRQDMVRRLFDSIMRGF